MIVRGMLYDNDFVTEESCHIEVGKREFGLAAAELMAKVIEKESKVI
ncbi:720_t:CDS:2 [Entrophospora sp. SA101]|nr:720_t:CDS:2 [Entrophospora sp. SA101]